MDVSRRNFIAGGAAVGITAAVSGCKNPPVDELGRTVGRGVGGATGLVLDQCGLKDEARNAVVGVVERIGACTPSEGESVSGAISRVAEEHVAELISGGRLTQVQGAAVSAAVTLLLKGWAIVEYRYPEAKAWCGFSAAAIGGFCDGFLSVYKPADSGENACGGCCEIDVQAFRALQATPEAKSLGVGK